MQQKQALFDFDRLAIPPQITTAAEKSRVAEATSFLHPQPPSLQHLFDPIGRSCIPKPYLTLTGQTQRNSTTATQSLLTEFVMTSTGHLTAS